MNELNFIFEWRPYKAAPDTLLLIVFQKRYETNKDFVLKLFNLCLKLSIYVLRELETSNCHCNAEKQQKRS